MPRPCPIHNSPKGPEVLRRVFEGVLDLRAAARELDVSYPLMWRCYNYHYKMKASAKGVSLELKESEEMEEVEFTEDLKGIIQKLKHKVDEVLSDPSVRDRPTAWIHQFRGCIRDLAELEGKLQRAPLIQLTQLNVQFEHLTTFLIRDLCEDCREKAAKFIAEIAKQKQIIA